MKTLSKLSLISVTEEAVYCNIGDEIVILNMGDETYYGMNPVGSFIWNLIQKPMTVAELESAIYEKYDVDKDVCNRDLEDLLNKLINKGLVEVKNENCI